MAFGDEFNDEENGGSVKFESDVAPFKPKADIVAAIDAIMAIQNYAISQSEKLVELDVNPLLLCAEGAFAADALIVLEEKTQCPK